MSLEIYNNSIEKGETADHHFNSSRSGDDRSDRRKAREFRLSYHSVEPIVVVIDVALVVTLSVLAGLGYHRWVLDFYVGYERYVAIGILVFINFAAIMAARGNYQVNKLVNLQRQLREACFIWIGVFLVLLGVAFSLKAGEDFSRGAVLTFFALGLIGMLCWRKLLADALANALANGTFARRNVIVLGERDRLAASGALAEALRCGYRPVRTFEVSPEDSLLIQSSSRLQRTIDAAIRIAREEHVEEILLAVGWQHNLTIESIGQMLSVLPIPVLLLPDEKVSRYVDRHNVVLGRTWAAEIQRAPLSRVEQFAKRSFDATGAFFAILLFSPMILLTALLIKLDSSGPALFFQTRNGFNGRAFRIVKFRTMHVLEDGGAIRQATRNDPRVTRLGRLLRRSNLDELPQLLNILRGDMSLVGPRPHAAAHNNEYEKLIGNYAFRNHVKPGLTGWAQVHGYRGETPTTELMAKRIELDLWYINNWNLWLDIKILLRTLFLGFQKSGY
jgi:Undecaprenyl-phosphate glucose phosphotransferase